MTITVEEDRISKVGNGAILIGLGLRNMPRTRTSECRGVRERFNHLAIHFVLIRADSVDRESHKSQA